MEESPNAQSIGICAGLVWHYLSKNGKTSLIKLKLEISSTASILHLALGWLLREGKVEFSRDKGYLFVDLKRG